MFSAKEAKVNTQKQIEAHIEDTLKSIEKEINKAIVEGRFSFSQSGTLQPEVKHKLKELGYEVTFGSQYNESFYNISWANADYEIEME